MAAGPSSGLAISTEDEIAITKLEYLKELRDVTFDLNSLKSRLKQEIETMESEKNCLSVYRKEKEFLEQEKMAHVDELRLIHSDLHQMESVIKESEEEHNNHLNAAKSLLQEWQQLKEHANRMRTELGLNRLSELSDEEDKIKHELFKGQHVTNHVHSNNESINTNLMMNKSMLSMSSNTPHSYLNPVPPTSARNFKQNLTGSRINPISGPASHQFSATPSNSISERQGPPAFRQQPPPMKSCLSCQQQIHRNAPICPLCKAKSRSRNPKKPKRKNE